MKTLSLVGGARTTSYLWKQYPADEIWTLAYMHKNGLKEADLIFEMHKREDTSPERWDYVWSAGVDLLMLQNYLLGEIRADLFKYLPIDEHFTSSFDYMLGAAIYCNRFNRVQIFGFEMEMNKEWFYQRPGAYLMMGIAAGRGIEIFIPERSNLMKPQLYGYDGIPKIDPEAIEKLEIIRQGYERQN